MATKFTDAQFMSASEKAKVAKHWAAFVKGGFRRSQFTKALYQHLHLHYGFIAHYDIDGFYMARFQSPRGLVQTLRAMRTYRFSPEYVDICTHLASEYDLQAITADMKDELRRLIIDEILERVDRLRDQFGMEVGVHFDGPFDESVE